MTRRVLWYAGGACALLALLSVGIAFDSRSASSASAALATGTPPRSAPPAILPTSLPAYIRQPLTPPVGSRPPVPSLTPSDGVTALIPSAPTTDPHKAAFTEQDVRTYLQAHPIKSNTGAPATLVSISFLTVDQANAAAPVRLNFVGDGLVCLIVHEGPFSVSTGPGAHPSSKMYDVLDAHSGNLLVTAFS